MRNWKVWDEDAPSFDRLWAMVGRLTMPVALWQGSLWSVVSDADVHEWMRRAPHSDHAVVEDSGHAVSSDKPLESARLIEGLLSHPV